MNLQNKYFNFIKNGTKRIELRLNDEKRQKIKVGDIIEFNRGKEKIKVRVINLLYYNTFNELLNDYDISKVSDKKMTKEELLRDLDTYYTQKLQKKYGILGIEFELLPKIITIKEPWASLIINGYKEYEFRSWKTNYKGRILIHAGLSTDKEINQFENLKLDYGHGEIIGEATITKCIKVNQKLKNKLIKKNSLVYKNINYNRNYAFYLTNIKKYKQRIKCKGKLGIWNYEGEQL